MRTLAAIFGMALGIAASCPVAFAQDACLTAQTIDSVEVARSVEVTASERGGSDAFLRLTPFPGLRVSVPAGAGALIRERDGNCEPLLAHAEGTTFEVLPSTEYLEVSLPDAARLAGDASTAGGSEAYAVRLALAPDDAVQAGNFAQATQAPGQRTLAAVAMLNTGTTTWTAADGYQLLNVGGSLAFGPVPLPVGVSIAPGQRADFFFELIAPAAPGTYPHVAQMGRGGQPFGAATQLVEVVVDPIHVDNARILSQTIPDRVLTNEFVVVELDVRNEGTTTWTGAGGYALARSGLVLFGFSTSPFVPAGVAVAPGQTYTFQIIVRAPDREGFYRFQLQMARSGTLFGTPGPVRAIFADEPLFP